MQCLRFGRRYGVDPRENLLTFDKGAEDEANKLKQDEGSLEARRQKRASRALGPPGFAVRSGAGVFSCQLEALFHSGVCLLCPGLFR